VYTEDKITFPVTKSLHDVDGWQSFQDDANHFNPETFLFDAQRFSHKVYAQLDAFESGERYVVWLDADCVAKAKLTPEFFIDLLDGHFCAFLGRKQTYTETGFLIFDTHHPDMEIFKHRYREFYDKRLLYLLDYWVDCSAFDSARKGLSGNNLTPEAEGMIDVFRRSPLGKVLDHDKGARIFRREIDEQVSNTA